MAGWCGGGLSRHCARGSDGRKRAWWWWWLMRPLGTTRRLVVKNGKNRMIRSCLGVCTNGCSSTIWESARCYRISVKPLLGCFYWCDHCRRYFFGSSEDWEDRPETEAKTKWLARKGLSSRNKSKVYIGKRVRHMKKKRIRKEKKLNEEGHLSSK